MAERGSFGDTDQGSPRPAPRNVSRIVGAIAVALLVAACSTPANEPSAGRPAGLAEHPIVGVPGHPEDEWMASLNNGDKRALSDFLATVPEEVPDTAVPFWSSLFVGG